MDVTFFRTLSLTKGLTAAEIDRLGRLVIEKRVAAGDKLLTEGAAAAGVFLVRDGKVKVTKRNAAKAEKGVARLEAPTVLGELELISGRPCFASAVAETEVLAYVLSPEAFDALVNGGDSLASKMTRNIARVVIDRLAETNTRLVAVLNA